MQYIQIGTYPIVTIPWLNNPEEETLHEEEWQSHLRHHRPQIHHRLHRRTQVDTSGSCSKAGEHLRYLRRFYSVKEKKSN